MRFGLVCDGVCIAVTGVLRRNYYQILHFSFRSTEYAHNVARMSPERDMVEIVAKLITSLCVHRRKTENRAKYQKNTNGNLFFCHAPNHCREQISTAAIVSGKVTESL